MNNKFKNWLGILPAAVVAVCVYTSLSGYVAPVINSETEAVQNREDSSNLTDNISKDSSSNTVAIENVSDKKKYKDGTYEGIGTGFAGEIKVQVTIKDGKISDIKILNTSDGAVYINRASSLLSEIINKQTTNVDTVSGATFSSKGLIQAVRSALNKAAVSDEYVIDIGTSDVANIVSANSKASAPNISKVSEPKEYKDGTYIGEGAGFAGKIKVRVTIKDGKIKDIKLLSSSDGTSYISRASKLLSNIIKKQSTNVDTVSGATYSSAGLIQAVRNALKNAAVNPQKSASNSNTNNDKVTKTITPAKTEGKFPYKDGTYTGIGEGYRGDIKVSVTIKNKCIASISIISKSDDDAFFNRAKAIINTILNSQSTEVDVVSGATYSSNGIIDAIQNALKEADRITNAKSDSSKNDSSKTEIRTDSSSMRDDSVAETQYTDGTYTASAICVADEDDDFDAYNLSVTITIKSDKIISITNVHGYGNDYDSDNDWYINRAANGTSKYTGITSQYINKDLNANIDAVSAATCSSKAIIKAVNEAISKAKK